MLDASRSWDPEPDVKLTSPERMMEGLYYKRIEYKNRSCRKYVVRS